MNQDIAQSVQQFAGRLVPSSLNEESASARQRKLVIGSATGGPEQQPRLESLLDYLQCSNGSMTLLQWFDQAFPVPEEVAPTEPPVSGYATRIQGADPKGELSVGVGAGAWTGLQYAVYPTVHHDNFPGPYPTTVKGIHYNVAGAGLFLWLPVPLTQWSGRATVHAAATSFYGNLPVILRDGASYTDGGGFVGVLGKFYLTLIPLSFVGPGPGEYGQPIRRDKTFLWAHSSVGSNAQINFEPGYNFDDLEIPAKTYGACLVVGVKIAAMHSASPITSLPEDRGLAAVDFTWGILPRIHPQIPVASYGADRRIKFSGVGMSICPELPTLEPSA
jgi:hypothetical protein